MLVALYLQSLSSAPFSLVILPLGASSCLTEVFSSFSFFSSFERERKSWDWGQRERENSLQVLPPVWNPRAGCGA